MRFEQLQRDIVYRVIDGNESFAVGDLVWIDSLFVAPHLNSMQQGACLDAEDLAEGTAGLAFTPQPNWAVETKQGSGGYSRVRQETHGKFIVVSIYKQYLDKILTGEKTLEVRTSWPRGTLSPFTVLLYETGACGGTKRIRARATCTGCTLLRDTDIGNQHAGIIESFSQKSCLSEVELAEYMGHHSALYGWRLKNVRPLDAALSDFGVKRAPQSWCYAQTSMVATTG